jgi:hypothetical protein
MFTRTIEQMEESQYIVDVTNRRIEQRFSDGRVVLTPMPSSGVKSISPLIVAMDRRK